MNVYISRFYANQESERQMARVKSGKELEKGNGMVAKLREKMLNPPELCIERGYFITE